jgi:hypothetical protein
MRASSGCQAAQPRFWSLAVPMIVLSALSLSQPALCGPIHEAAKKGDLAKGSRTAE